MSGLYIVRNYISETLLLRCTICHWLHRHTRVWDFILTPCVGWVQSCSFSLCLQLKKYCWPLRCTSILEKVGLSRTISSASVFFYHLMTPWQAEKTTSKQKQRGIWWTARERIACDKRLETLKESSRRRKHFMSAVVILSEEGGN